MHREYRNRQALSRAQAKWDNMLPPDTDMVKDPEHCAFELAHEMVKESEWVSGNNQEIEGETWVCTNPGCEHYEDRNVRKVK